MRCAREAEKKGKLHGCRVEGRPGGQEFNQQPKLLSLSLTLTHIHTQMIWRCDHEEPPLGLYSQLEEGISTVDRRQTFTQDLDNFTWFLIRQNSSSAVVALRVVQCPFFDREEFETFCSVITISKHAVI